MASTTLNLVGSLSVSDALVKSVSPNRYTESIEDSLDVLEVFGKIQTERYFKSLEDGLAIGDVIGVVKWNVFVFTFEETIILNDDFNKTRTLRIVLFLESTLQIVDELVIDITNFPNLSFEEFIGLTDPIIVKGTNRIEIPLFEALTITSELSLLFGIRVIDGTIDGESFKSFLQGTSGTLIAVQPLNWIFVRWGWLGEFREGIENIYKPTTTLIVPYGGGDIAAEFVNPGAFAPNIKSLVIVIELFDFEYVKDPDGDYILTKETITLVGDSMGVARTNLTIEQGAAFLRIVIYRDNNGNPVDLTGYTAKMQIRKTKDSSTVILELSTSNGLLVLGGVSGTITMALATGDTDPLDFVWGRYDLELYPDGDTTQAIRLLEGKINLSKQVTQ